MSDLLEDLISKHNYMVKVSLAEEDPLCVMVDFAGRKQAYYRVITDEEGEVYGISYWSSLMMSESTEADEGGFEEFLPMRSAVVRIYIMCEIYRQCRQMSLSHEIVRFFDAEDGKVEFTDLLQLALDEYDQQVEAVLENAMADILNGRAGAAELSDSLEKSGLLLTFNLLRSTLV